MSNVINFSAREFRFDKTCEDNTGIRAVITTSQGNTEAYEIGDWSWSWTQIFCDKKLEKNTDYITIPMMRCHWRKYMLLTATTTLLRRGRTE